MYRNSVFTLLIVLLMIGCNGAPVATLTPTEPPEAVIVEDAQAEVVAEVPTDAPTETAPPTEEPTLPPPVLVEDPTEEPAAEPTAEPVAEATVTTAPTITPSPVPVEASQPLLLSSAEDFIPQGRNPLTGELVEDPDILQRRPILCKISDSPVEWVRPQSGLNSADIIFEHYTEGVITRFSALFYGDTPERVGPIRSARLVDLELPLMYDAALCFSGGSSGQGANRGVWQLVFETGFAERVMRTDWPGYYRTGEDKPYEHTFYNRLAETWDYFDEIGLNQAPDYVTNMTFSDEVPAVSGPASSIDIRYGNGKGTFVEWDYDADSGQYLRSADGAPIIDANDDEQVSVSNVIVIKAPHLVNRNICETQAEDRCLAFSTELQIWGGGFVSVFRDGRQINGSWQRDDRYANGMMFTFYDDAGNIIPLKPGQSWVQFVPYEYIVTPIDVTP